MKILVIILIIGAFFRFYGLNWDQGQHLHPDERMITMVADRIRLPEKLQEWDLIFTPDSILNPHFFAYGSFPIYLLRVAGNIASTINADFGSYTSLNLVGRVLSTLFDLGTILVLYLIGKKLLNKQLGLLSAGFYTLATLPIQLSHFYAVDTALTFFITLVLYRLIIFNQKPSKTNIVLVGIFTGLALATKTSALVLLAPVALTIVIFIISSVKQYPKNLITIFFQAAVVSSLFAVSLFFIFSLAEPFALIDFPTFLKQTLEQQAMTKDAFTFPYTMQYVGKIPYLYELKNIFLWGLGPTLASLAFVSILFYSFQTFYKLITHKSSIANRQLAVLLVFFFIYFALIGSFAIGFMRYLLPIYPLLCLFAGLLLAQIYSALKHFLPPAFIYILYSIFYILVFIWPLSFLHIYSQPNTRNIATNWINTNIPPGNTIATEHWDDGLPIGTQNRYQINELTLYDPDTPEKWTKINQQLADTDYIIIASNRLYFPLQKLTDCTKLPPGRCYPQTAKYYQDLFSGQLGFNKVAEFSVLPKFSIFNFQFSIDDFAADESFTVYDHPKVIIFKRI